MRGTLDDCSRCGELVYRSADHRGPSVCDDCARPAPLPTRSEE
ncbi:hypothetical protein [Clavibacter michiganensis]|nr:hypothetical protein [Clavibacter michiganensis]